MDPAKHDFQNVQAKDLTLLVVLGGGLKKENGVWRTTYFDEGNEFGSLGDYLRVFAAAELYKDITARGENVNILAMGGVGRSKNPEHPTVSSVYKKELIELGIPDNVIITEEKSGSTFQQLQAMSDYSSYFYNPDIMLISNRYHLPRIEAMIRYAKLLSALSDMLQTKQLSLVSAEDVLLKSDPERWRQVINEAYNSVFMKKRTALEEQGIAQIQSSTYVFE